MRYQKYLCSLFLFVITIVFANQARAGIVGQWKFDEDLTNGDRVYDSSGYGNYGAIKEATRTAASHSGNALSLDGSNSYVDIGDDASLNLSNVISIEAWINADSAGANDYSRIISKFGTSSGWDFFIGSGVEKQVVLKVNDTFLISVDRAPVVGWHHIAVVYQSGVGAKFYFDGVSIGTDSRYTGPIVSNSSNVQIGKWPKESSRYFHGLIDEVTVYDHAFSDAEVLGLFSSVCGDGTLSSSEQCDDGNINGGDGCDSICVIESCGNGVLQAHLGEECDDGNTDDGDCCSAICKVEYVDGIKCGGEYFAAIATSANEYGWEWLDPYDGYLYYVPIDNDGSMANKVELSTSGTYPGYYTTNAVGVADFDNDGDYDILFAYGAGGGIYFYDKMGPGADFQRSLGPVASFDPSGYYFGAGDMAVADFDKDGKMDFAISGFNTHLKVYLGNGDGTFDQLAGVPGVPEPSGHLLGKDAADINCDGVVDLVAAAQHVGDFFFDYGELYVWLGGSDSSGNFIFNPPVSVYSPLDVDSPNDNMFGFGVVVDNYISSDPLDERLEILVTADVGVGSSYSSLNLLSRSSSDCTNIEFDVVTPAVGWTSPEKNPLFMDGFSLGEGSSPGVLYSWGYESNGSDAYTVGLECTGTACNSSDIDEQNIAGPYESSGFDVCVVATPRDGCIDEDGDGFYANCGEITDCDDGDGAIYPGADDTNCDGVDDNCNGTADDGYQPLDTECGVGACAATGATSCVEGIVQNSCTEGTPAAEDTDCDNIDDDCNGTTDDGYQPLNTECGVGACANTGVTSCVEGIVQDDCTQGDPETEVCDDVDNDCDGDVDEEGFLFGDFKQPIKSMDPDSPTSFKLGRTIPIKFTLSGCGGTNVEDASVAFYINKFSDDVTSGTPIDLETSEAADTGSHYRYDAGDAHYIYNLRTKGETAGTYMVYGIPENGQIHSVKIILK